jgi:hypothetical protein
VPALMQAAKVRTIAVPCPCPSAPWLCSRCARRAVPVPVCPLAVLALCSPRLCSRLCSRCARCVPALPPPLPCLRAVSPVSPVRLLLKSDREVGKFLC